MRTRTVVARGLRRSATDAERRLSWTLRDLLPQYRFRRQHPIGRFVVDFACPQLKLAIEIDGGQHATNEVQDQSRTTELARRGYRAIRFWNNDVLSNASGIVEIIWRELESRAE